jgi:hypothetical protein
MRARLLFLVLLGAALSSVQASPAAAGRTAGHGVTFAGKFMHTGPGARSFAAPRSVFVRRPFMHRPFERPSHFRRSDRSDFDRRPSHFRRFDRSDFDRRPGHFRRFERSDFDRPTTDFRRFDSFAFDRRAIDRRRFDPFAFDRRAIDFRRFDRFAFDRRAIDDIAPFYPSGFPYDFYPAGASMAAGGAPIVVVVPAAAVRPEPQRPFASDRPTVETTPQGVVIVRGPGSRHGQRW